MIEVGGHENSLEEAERTIPYLAEAIARSYCIFSSGLNIPNPFRKC